MGGKESERERGEEGERDEGGNERDGTILIIKLYAQMVLLKIGS